ncbi:hypothetical protein C7S16_4059 [Burkholderia thailandensis]|uniref:Short-chain dehydrogenase n=1 Tax=Burkholderia thailandensis TaxID=57975 RepID=A0AAW9D3J9_BURTH|nr:hypothetical protein [Burkholderia thailandensis]
MNSLNLRNRVHAIARCAVRQARRDRSIRVVSGSAPFVGDRSVARRRTNVATHPTSKLGAD